MNRLVARSRLTDVTDGSVGKQVAGAVARRLEQAYRSIARIMELYSVHRAQGEDLDARAREYMPEGYERRGASRAVGTLRWTRPTVTGTATTIPVGSVVAKKNANPRVTYVTTATGEIPAGGTQSQRTDWPLGDIPARADVAGASGNAEIDTATKQARSEERR